MSKSVMSTGEIHIRHGKATDQVEIHTTDDHCYAVILSNFSGKPAQHSKQKLGQRRLIPVDRDNLEDVFAKLKPCLSLPIADHPIEFEEFDDLHPDFIYEWVPLFANFRSLKRRLENPKTFAEAAAEVYGWTKQPESSPAPQKTDPAATAEVDDDLFTNILAEAQSREDSFDIQRLMRDIFAPYVTPAPDPRQAELIAAVDQAASHLLREILHHPRYQALEAAWRGLDLLLRRVETNNKLRIFILDVTAKELAQDAANCDDLESSALYQNLFGQKKIAGQLPINLVLIDQIFTYADITTLNFLAKLGQETGTAVIAGGSEKIVGCNNLVKTPYPADWQVAIPEGVAGAWQQLRDSAAAKYLCLTLPRYLVRMPYGRKSNPIESIQFEELPETNPHKYYLWGNGGWLMMLLLLDNFAKAKGWQFLKNLDTHIEDLPLHVFTVDDEPEVTPCAEILMTEATAEALLAAGLAIIRSVAHKNSVQIPQIMSIASGYQPLAGPWA